MPPEITQSRHRQPPRASASSVIFMDHMMPGMDGFQAVQSIKNNPRTAAIPILMYASQEGDLWPARRGARARRRGRAAQADQAIGCHPECFYQLQPRFGSPMRYRLNIGLHDVRPSAGPGTGQRIGVVVEMPKAATNDRAAAAAPRRTGEFALLREGSLEIRAALDQLAAARRSPRCATSSAPRFDSHSERLQGDLATLLPRHAYAGARSADGHARTTGRGAAILGWSMAFICDRGRRLHDVAVVEPRGAEATAPCARISEAAAYSELEALRARPVVVSPAPAAAARSPGGARSERGAARCPMRRTLRSGHSPAAPSVGLGPDGRGLRCRRRRYPARSNVGRAGCRHCRPAPPAPPRCRSQTPQTTAQAQ